MQVSPTPSEATPLRAWLALGIGLTAISTSVLFIRWATEAPGETVAVWRTVFGALLLVPAAATKARQEIQEMSGREWALIVGSGLFLGLHFVTWINALYFTSVASASALVALSPLFLAILGFVLFGERLTGRELLSLLLAIAGVAALGWIDRSPTAEAAVQPMLGNGLALSAAGFLSVYLLIGRYVRQRRSWLAYVAPVYVVTALTTVVVAIVQGSPLLGWGWEIYALCLGMALVPHVLGHGSLNWSLKYLSATTAGLASLGVPVVASLWGALAFAEVPSVSALGAMILILTALGLFVSTRR
jgi:drug/metabolite transporter (DMT)-like permease